MNTTERYCRVVRHGQTATLFLFGHVATRASWPDRCRARRRGPAASRVTLDGAALDTLDTAAALALLRRAGAAGATIEHLANFKEPTRR